MCKTLRRITRRYYPSWKHSLTALDKHTLIEMLDIFSLHAVVGLSVAATNNSCVVPLKSTLSRTASDMPTKTHI